MRRDTGCVCSATSSSHQHRQRCIRTASATVIPSVSQPAIQSVSQCWSNDNSTSTDLQNETSIFLLSEHPYIDSDPGPICIWQCQCQSASASTSRRYISSVKDLNCAAWRHLALKTNLWAISRFQRNRGKGSPIEDRESKIEEYLTRV